MNHEHKQKNSEKFLVNRKFTAIEQNIHPVALVIAAAYPCYGIAATADIDTAGAQTFSVSVIGAQGSAMIQTVTTRLVQMNATNGVLVPYIMGPSAAYGFVGGGGKITPLGAGDLVSAGQPWGNTNLSFVTWDYSSSIFQNLGGSFANTTRYAGFKIKNTGNNTPMYGWMQLNVTIVGGNLEIRVSKMALDRSGDPIGVGCDRTGCPTPPNPPNPPTAADLPAELSMLNLLGLGAIGLAAFRRRRDKFLTETETTQ
ncbi:hypothetical protein QUF74_03235 [Candidatus Halobeggiatoa sp. HSG11]|nr:hypothetical protein [Candidatus Halobeggiatoa sp. HSG11]